MQRKANRLLLLLIGTALAACSSTSEQGSSGIETEGGVVESTVQPPPPEPAPVQYTEAELDVGHRPARDRCVEPLRPGEHQHGDGEDQRGYRLSCYGSDGRPGGTGQAADWNVENGAFVRDPAGPQ